MVRKIQTSGEGVTPDTGQMQAAQPLCGQWNIETRFRQAPATRIYSGANT